MDEVTPMLRRYSRWNGDTARSTDSDRSRGSPPSTDANRAVASSTSAMTRIQLRSYSRRACGGTSVAGNQRPSHDSPSGATSSAITSPGPSTDSNR
jgi:hypothetical protein